MVALAAGAAVLMPVLYYHQIAQLDETLENDSHEFLRDLQNFKGAPVDPRRPLARKFIPLALQSRYLLIEGPEGQILYQSNNLRGTRLAGEAGQSRTMALFGRNCRIGTWQEGPYLVHIGTRLGTIERFQSDLRRGLLLALPVVGLVVFFGGHWLGRRAVAPVADLSVAAEWISAAAPQERLPMPGGAFGRRPRREHRRGDSRGSAGKDFRALQPRTGGRRERPRPRAEHRPRAGAGARRGSAAGAGGRGMH